ncbi:MAG: hypothetical protein IID41_06275 [Planctomycetes bacterium]|nr:hypothetical protein [Planctomycetota bacterium]
MCEVYVVFDDPADRLISVAFTNVSTTDPQGFFQHPLGGNTAPACASIALEPTLVCDSFVSLGVDCFDLIDRTTTDPDFDSTAFNTSGEVSGGWYNSAPSSGQGDPDANGRVLIARFSYKQNKTSSGDVCIFTQIGGSGGDIVAFLLEPFDCAVPGGGLPASGGTIWYVDDDGTPGNGCTSWSDACPDLQTALGSVDPLGDDQIWVAEGTYRPSGCAQEPDGCLPTHRNDAFVIPSGVLVYGGFEGTEPTLQQRKKLFDTTILTGDLNGDDVPEEFPNTLSFAENSYHVVIMSHTDDVVFDGFKVTAGNANVNDHFLGGGAGLYAVPVDGATIENCTFTMNFALCSGGGALALWEFLADGLVIRECQFVKNEAVNGGGGLSIGGLFELRDCEFRENNVDPVDGLGGGLKSISSGLGFPAGITGCHFEQNMAAAGGGAWITAKDGHFLNCSFQGNIALEGAGVQTQCAGENALPLRFTNCLFAGHDTEAIHSRGGTFLPDLSVDGCSGIGTSAVLCPASSAPGFKTTNCTFVQNGTAIKPRAPLEVVSSLFWDNGSEINLLGSPPNTCSGSYSNVQGGIGVTGCTDVAGNIGELPAHEPTFFADDDFRTTSGSPGNDAGDNLAVPPGVDKDLSGSPRFVNDDGAVDCEFFPDTCGTPPIIDMGAYEFQDCGPCRWDTPLSGPNGQVGAEDLAFLLGNWGPIPPDPDPAVLCLDIEPDGVIGAFDLANLLGNWGPCL